MNASTGGEDFTHESSTFLPTGSVHGGLSLSALPRHLQLQKSPGPSIEVCSKRKHAQSNIQTAMERQSEGAHKVRRLEHTYTASPSFSAANQQQSGYEEVRPQKDWRQFLCDTLGVSQTISDDDLEVELEDAMDSIKPLTPLQSHPVSSQQSPKPFYKILHRVLCHADNSKFPAVYSDEPFLSNNDDVRVGCHLKGINQVSDLDRYMERNIGMSFVVIHEYFCCNVMRIRNPHNQLVQESKTIIIKSQELCTVLGQLQAIVPNGDKLFPSFIPGKEYYRLQHAIYWHQADLSRLLAEIQAEDSRSHFMCFFNYLEQHQLREFQELDSLLAKPMVARKLLPYLFVPGNVYILTHPQGKEHYRGVRLLSWPSLKTSWGDQATLNERRQDDNIITTYIDLELEAWDFDGNFKKTGFQKRTTIQWEGDITKFLYDLDIYPYTLADTSSQRMLMNRGNMFWRCRFRNFISYSGWDLHNEELFKDSRFMIDNRSFKAALKGQAQTQPHQSGQATLEGFPDALGQEAMDRDEPPGDDFILLLPTCLNGFNMNDKLWKKLLVSRMEDITWDDRAFQSLVLPEDTKDVIKALIKHRVSSSFSTDLIRGKGSGLILLFHGPPGTGKTLTAESVADHARKPLYRVTCGDIGTQPDDVERYLTRVLRLAKLWDCVMLLDEAEVFLQKRSLEDLHRNALVSGMTIVTTPHVPSADQLIVFLRVLEYYDGEAFPWSCRTFALLFLTNAQIGILILTSNQVGTLDEGFKSRIQLALEYPKLDGDSRRKVWENFVNSLNSDPAASAEIDIHDLRRNLRDLSQYELNGREIRNAINVARPLALSTGTQVDLMCLKKVIRVQQRFGKYIKDMNEGIDDDSIAREDGKR
ncbi:ATPase [Fusarium proliferatum]|nr:ATPase [Fusarium proliferatum]